MSGSIERIDHVDGPAVEGRFYLVPTVRAAWCGQVKDWPVIGPIHSDPEFFDFNLQHYHVDARFLPKRYRYPERTFTLPLHISMYSAEKRLPKPVARRRKCVRAMVPYTLPPHVTEHSFDRTIGALRKAYAGQQCDKGKGGWVCPHRKASLGSITPVEGIVTCPLHGLRVEAATGKVLGAAAVG